MVVEREGRGLTGWVLRCCATEGYEYEAWSVCADEVCCGVVGSVSDSRCFGPEMGREVECWWSLMAWCRMPPARGFFGWWNWLRD